MKEETNIIHYLISTLFKILLWIALLILPAIEDLDSQEYNSEQQTLNIALDAFEQK